MAAASLDQRKRQPGLDERKADVVTLGTRAPALSPPARTTVYRPYLALLRPAQWPKNLVVALAPVIDASLWQWRNAAAVAFGVLLFTGAASIIYIINDLADRDRDRAHPTKRLRPIASGAVRPTAAIVLASILAAALVAVMALRPGPLDIPILTYIALNVVYSRELKHVSPLDVFVLAAGFVLRVACGALAVRDPVSPWLMLSVLSVALLLGLGKRRREMVLLNGADAAQHRPALRGYSQQLIDSLIPVAGAVGVVGYMSFMSTEVSGRPYGGLTVAVSTLLVMFGLARYLQLLVVGGGGADPVHTLITDWPLVIVGFLWILCFAAPPAMNLVIRM